MSSRITYSKTQVKLYDRNCNVHFYKGFSFKMIYISKYNVKGIDETKFKIKIKTIGKVEELYQALFV